MVRAGFKRTEVGVIPEDWKVLQLAEFASIGSGGTPNRGNSAYWDGDIPWITTTQIDGTIITKTSEQITNLGLSKSAAKIYPKGTLLMAMYGQGKTRGKVGVMGIDASINQACAAIQIQSRAQPSFALHYLNWSYEKIRELSNSGGQENLSSGIVKALHLPLPPTSEEQKAIAGALSDVDGLIAGLEALIAKKCNLKTATMQQLLTGKTRLPGFGHEWQPQSIIELCDGQKSLFDDGDWVEAEHITDKGIRLIQTGNIGIGHFEESTRQKYVNQKSFEKLRCKEVLQGDLLICRLADPAGRACVMPDIGEQKVITSVDVTIARPPVDKADRRFLAQVMCTDVWFDAVAQSTGGTTHKRISRGNLGKIEIMLPKLNEQTAIADVLVDMDLDISTVICRLAKAKAVKQGMMQELLTGRTRLI